MCCKYCKHENTSRDRSGDHNMVGRTYPSFRFSRLAIDLVKPVKQVSIKRIFSGSWLIRWKVVTNSVLYLKQQQQQKKQVGSSSLLQTTRILFRTKKNAKTITFLYSSSTSRDAGSLTSPLVCSKAGNTTWLNEKISQFTFFIYKQTVIYER